MPIKSFCLLAGLPRCGSTVLGAILNQHPEIHASTASHLLPSMRSVVANWGGQHIAANPNHISLGAMLSGMMEGAYAHVEKQTVFDKNRSWAHPFNLEMIERVTGTRPKVVCMVRPITDILASWLTVMSRNDRISKIDEDIVRCGFDLTDEGRCRYLMSIHGSVREAWTHLQEAKETPYWSTSFLFIEYDAFVSDPQVQMDRIHQFIDLPPFSYDFENIQANEVEDDDAAYGLRDLHTVRPRLEKVSVPAIDVLGSRLYHFYDDGEMWSNKAPKQHFPQVLDLQLEAGLKGDFVKGWSLAQFADEADDRAQFNKGWYLIQRGHLREGMCLLERGRKEGLYGKPSRSSMPQWSGQMLRGQTVLLEAECGIGDQIVHARFAKDIAARGGKVVLSCDSGIAPILSTIQGVSAIVQSEAAAGVYHQYHVPAMSAARILEYEHGDLDGDPYIKWPRHEQQHQRRRVGICWRGNPAMTHDVYRRFDPKPLFNLPDVDLISLQKICDEDAPNHVIKPSLDNWEKTASVIAGLDLIVTSCTAVAHLSAAMGKTTWVLTPILPYYLWAVPGDKSPWYRCVRLFRQTAPMNWSETFDVLNNAFDDWLCDE